MVDGKKDELLFITFGDHPPYHSVAHNGRLTGFDVDVAQAISKVIDQKIKIQVVPKEEVRLCHSASARTE